MIKTNEKLYFSIERSFVTFLAKFFLLTEARINHVKTSVQTTVDLRFSSFGIFGLVQFIGVGNVQLSGKKSHIILFLLIFV